MERRTAVWIPTRRMHCLPGADEGHGERVWAISAACDANLTVVVGKVAQTLTMVEPTPRVRKATNRCDWRCGGR
jgi:hypothetical protein